MPVAPMRSLPTSSAAVVVLLCVAALLHSATAGRCAELAPFVAPASLQYPHVCQAEQGWKAIPALWAPVEVVVNCSSSSVSNLSVHQCLPCMHALPPMLYMLCCLQLLLQSLNIR
jgi:hypothetical protein